MISKQAKILDANAKDLADGTKAGLAKPLLSRLSLTPAKLKSLSVGLKQIADSSHKVNLLCYVAMSCFGINFTLFIHPSKWKLFKSLTKVLIWY